MDPAAAPHGEGPGDGCESVPLRVLGRHIGVEAGFFIHRVTEAAYEDVHEPVALAATSSPHAGEEVAAREGVPCRIGEGPQTTRVESVVTYFLGTKAQAQRAGYGFVPLPGALRTLANRQLSMA